MASSSSSSAVLIEVADGFDFDAYEQEVKRKIISSPNPVHVTWDLSQLTFITFNVGMRQYRFMQSLGDSLWESIIDSTVIIGNDRVAEYIRLFFRHAYSPRRPVRIVSSNGSGDHYDLGQFLSDSTGTALSPPGRHESQL